MKLIIALLFVAILASLATGLRFLLKPKGDSSKRVLDALTLRIALSVLLFLLLLLAWYTGLIQPHGLQPPPA